MTTPGKRRLRPILVALAAAGLVVGTLVVWLLRPEEGADGDFTRIPLSASPFLAEVVEPIEIVKGVYNGGSDDHWMSVTFRDARRVDREVRYVIYYPDVQKTLFLGKTKVPPGGREEHAFLGLLQRWYRLDAEARDVYERLQNRDPSIQWTPLGPQGLTEAQAAKAQAVGLMKRLEKRE